MDPADAARTIIAANAYMTLATADAGGTPWASPVWYAPTSDYDFVWISRPEARHSRNIAQRHEVGIVIFDSQVAIGAGRAVYADAVAAEVPAEDIEAMTEVFTERSLIQGGDELMLSNAHRLYRATPEQVYFGEHDQRTPVVLV